MRSPHFRYISKLENQRKSQFQQSRKIVQPNGTFLQSKSSQYPHFIHNIFTSAVDFRLSNPTVSRSFVRNVLNLKNDKRETSPEIERSETFPKVLKIIWKSHIRHVLIHQIQISRSNRRDPNINGQKIQFLNPGQAQIQWSLNLNSQS